MSELKIKIPKWNQIYDSIYVLFRWVYILLLAYTAFDVVIIINFGIERWCKSSFMWEITNFILQTAGLSYGYHLGLRKAKKMGFNESIKPPEVKVEPNAE